MDTESKRYMNYPVDAKGIIKYKFSKYICDITSISIYGITLYTDANLKLNDIIKINDVILPHDNEKFSFLCSVEFKRDNKYECQFTNPDIKNIRRLSKIIYELYFK